MSSRPMGIACALAMLVACKTPPPKKGDVCAIEDEGTMVCADAHTALLCKASRRTPIPCRGPRGCAGTKGVLCDTTLAREGDACFDPYGAYLEKRACAEDKAAALVCRDHRFVLELRCRGPKGCDASTYLESSWNAGCDRTIGEEGDPCNVSAYSNTDREACSPDHKSVLGCNKDNKGTLVVTHLCSGPSGCETGEYPKCDHAGLAVGARCGKNDGDQCSADGSLVLRCDPSTLAYVKEEECGPKRRCARESSGWVRCK